MKLLIPSTTPLSYISGYHSLNLDLGDTTGYGALTRKYWLDSNYYIPLWGKNQPRSTNNIFGYYGIADRSKELTSMGINCGRVFIANHYRATADVVFSSLKKFSKVGIDIKLLDTIFKSDSQQYELFNYLIHIRFWLNDVEKKELILWLSNYYNTLYEEWLLGEFVVTIHTMCSPREWV